VRSALRRLTILCAAALAVLGAWAAPAQARDATPGEFAQLVRGASENDREALEELRSVTSVDGRPVDVGAALDGAEGAELRGRLRALEAEGSAADPGTLADPAAARARASEILDQRRFKKGSVPRPLHGLFTKIGNAAEDLFRPVEKLFDKLAARVPGGRSVLWTLIAVIVLAAAALVTNRSVRHRAAAAERLRGERVGGERGDDPDLLERAAADAEAAGQLDLALRLRFRAGLLRLDSAQAIEFRPSITTAEVSGALRSPAFDGLALTFEQVAYGGRPASPPDVDAARREWPALLEEVRGA
jgi:hypothetical protein